MDVSRIEAFNPNRINWKILTAKEIMKYERQGIEVPDVYLQWAQEFLNSVHNNDNDNVTYEAAKAEERHSSSGYKLKENSKKDQFNDVNNVEDAEDVNESQENEANSSASITSTEPDNADASSEGEDGGELNPEIPQMSKAQSKRKSMQDNGVGLRSQALSFRSDSKESSRAAMVAAIVMQLMESESDEQTQELEGQIASLLSEASAVQQEFKNEINNINKDHSDASTFAKIEQLQKQLTQYGVNGQQMISDAESDLGTIDGGLNSATPTLDDAKDFGSVSVEVGDELVQQAKHEHWLLRIIDLAIGKSASRAGTKAIDRGEQGESVQAKAIGTNNSNLSSASSLHIQVEQKTGVAAAEKGKKAESESDTSKDPETGETKEADKNVKLSNNDGTDTTDKADISIDEILKRKIRKGENVDDNYA